LYGSRSFVFIQADVSAVLPEVFKPKEKPWITPEGSTTEKIIAQVKRCPSGALSFFMNNDEQATK
jgi:hypothetical protein